MLENIFITVINMSITASIAALVVILLRAMSDKYLPKSFSYAIWVVVLLRLLIPFSFSSAVSLFNIMPVKNANISPDQKIVTISYIPTSAAVIDLPGETIPDTQLRIESSVDPYKDLDKRSAVDVKETDEFNTKEVVYFSLRILWLAGMLLMLSYIVYCYVKTAQKFKTAVLVRDREPLEECKKVLGVNRKIQIFSSEVIDTPAVIGLIKPRIILPARLVDPRIMDSANSLAADVNAADSLGLADFNNEADAHNEADSFNEDSLNKVDDYSFRKYIIIHELVHIKRLDYLIKPLSLLLLCVHWFNPVIWLSSRLFHKDMEMACDEKVIRVSKGDVRAEYASSLINMAARQNHSFGNGLLAFGESNIKSRVKGIMSYKKPAFWVGSIVVLFIAAASVLLLTNPLQSIETVADAGAANISSSSDVPLTLSTSEVRQGNRQFNVKLLMTVGNHITHGDPGPYGSDYYEGNLVGEVYDLNGNLLSKTDMTQYFTETLIFRGKFNIFFDDYNGDGRYDFTVGQYLGSNFQVFNIFTIEDNGDIKKLPVEKSSDGIMCSEFDELYSTRFTKVSENGIKVTVYDMNKGEYIDKTYRWEGRQFILVTPNGGSQDNENNKKMGNNEKFLLKDGSSVNSVDLIDRLDKSDESAKYVYDKSPDNIKVGTIFEGSFSGAGKKELLVIFKFLEMPHAGGLDYSVAAIFDRNTLNRLSQKAFVTDEAQFALFTDRGDKVYLLYSGTTTYQGSSSGSLEMLSLRDNWENRLPQDSLINSNGRFRFELMQNGIVAVQEPVFTENVVSSWNKVFYLKWNSNTAELEDYIPDTYINKAGEKFFDTGSVSPDGRYAAVEHKWDYNGSSYVLIYDIRKNRLSKKYELLAQEFGYSWSPDSRKLCVTRLARIWMDTTLIDVEKKTSVSMLEDGAASFQKLKTLGTKFSYELIENRPDPYIQICQWSPDSRKVLLYYQWTDNRYNRQSGNFVYNLDNKTLSKITQNSPEPGGGNLEPVEPKGFKW